MPEIKSLQPPRAAMDMLDLPGREPRGRAGEDAETPFGLLVSGQARPPQANGMQKNPPAPLERVVSEGRPPRARAGQDDGSSADEVVRSEDETVVAGRSRSEDDAPNCRMPGKPDERSEKLPEQTDVTGGVQLQPEDRPVDVMTQPVEPPVIDDVKPVDLTAGVMTAPADVPAGPMIPVVEVPVVAVAPPVPVVNDAATPVDPAAEAVIAALGAVGKDNPSNAAAAATAKPGVEIPVAMMQGESTAGEPATADAFAAIAAKNPENPAPVKSAALEAQARPKPGAEAPKAAVFADWINDFAQGQGAFHRSGDLVGSLDRALTAIPTPHAGQDALRPTPLQMMPIEIGMQAMRGVTKFQIRLDPAELGRVDVQLEFKQDGEVKANLVVDRVETLAMLKRDAHTLQQAFEQAGLRQSPDGMTFSLRNEGQQNREGQRQDDASGNGRRNWGPEDEALMGEMPPEIAMRRVMIPNSTVDLMV